MFSIFDKIEFYIGCKAPIITILANVCVLKACYVVLDLV